MNDYNELIERCKEICDWQDTGLLKGDALRNFAASRPYAQQHNSVSIAQAETLREVADAFLVMAARVAGLEAARIAYASEFPPDAEGLPDTGSIHANIRAMKARVAELESRLEISPLHNVDGIMARDATIKLQDERIAEHGQVTVTTDESGRVVSVTRQDDEHRILSVIWEAPVTAPVRLTDRDKDGLAVPYSGMGGIEDYRAYAQDIETAALRANGFKVEE